MRLTETSLIAAVGFATVWIAAMASCSDEDPDNLLTTNATMMQTTGGSGGTASDGGGGAGANTAGGSTGTNGGQGGQGGEPEMAIHGCLSTTAMDLTGDTPPHVINYPGAGPICIKINDGDTVDFNHAPNAFRVLYGTNEGGVKSLRIPSGCNDSPQTNCPNWVFCAGTCPSEPHYCPNSPYVCGDIPVTGPLNKVAASEQVGLLSVFPFFDDFDDTVKGVVYVE